MSKGSCMRGTGRVAVGILTGRPRWGTRIAMYGALSRRSDVDEIINTSTNTSRVDKYILQLSRRDDGVGMSTRTVYCMQSFDSLSRFMTYLLFDETGLAAPLLR